MNRARPSLVLAAALIPAALSLTPVSAASSVPTLAGFPHRVQTRLLGTTDSLGLGTSAALASGVAVLGAPDQTGAGVTASGVVEVYNLTAGVPRTLKPAATLLSAQAQADAEFGYAVAADSDTIVVGAPAMTESGQANAGAAYIYQRPAQGWQHLVNPSAVLVPPSPEPNEGFGMSVAVDGTTVVVGAPHADGGAGDVFEFTEPNSGWSGGSTPSSAGLSDGLPGGELGRSVTVDGNVIAAGAPNRELESPDNGAIDLFVEPDSGGWATTSAPSRVLVESNPAASQDLGISVAMYGDLVVGGAPGLGGNGLGRVDQFTLPTGGWAGSTPLVQSSQLSDATAPNNSEFAIQVAVDGSEILAGVPVETVAGKTWAGMVDIFARPKPGWSNTTTPTARVVGSSPAPQTLFGAALGDDGAGRILVSAPLTLGSGGSTDTQGTAYLFTALQLPTLSKVSQSHKSWKRGTKLPALNPKKAIKGGTAYRFTANQVMPVTFAFAKRSHGHYGAAHDLKVPAVQGRNVLYFDGRLAKSATLRAGTYRVVITAKNAAGDRTRAVTLHFTVARAAR